MQASFLLHSGITTSRVAGLSAIYIVFDPGDVPSPKALVHARRLGRGGGLRVYFLSLLSFLLSFCIVLTLAIMHDTVPYLLHLSLATLGVMWPSAIYIV